MCLWLTKNCHDFLIINGTTQKNLAANVIKKVLLYCQSGNAHGTWNITLNYSEGSYLATAIIIGN